MRSDCKSARTKNPPERTLIAQRSPFNVHHFLKGVQEFRSDASLRSVDVCLTSNLSSLISHPSSFNVQRSSPSLYFPYFLF